MRVLSSIEQLDEVLREVAEAGKISDDEMRRVFGSFRMEHPTALSADPHSEEYRRTQLDLYRAISGRGYEVGNEGSPFVDPETACFRPFPYYTGSCATVGNHLMAVGHAIRCLDLGPGSTILEFGPGWGNTTIALAMAGFKVTAVDIEPRFCELIRRRALLQGVDVEVVNAEFSYIERIEEPVDAVLFFECFHHSSDHQAVLAALDNAIKPGGKALFAAEQILPDFPVPWGPRMDGESLWAMRQNGWLELGFNERYFTEALARFGWGVRKHELSSLPHASCFEAKRRKSWSYRYFGAAPEIRSQAGTKTKSTLCVKSENPGYIMFGPYESLPAGSWLASVTIRGLSAIRPTGYCTMDVCSDGTVHAALEVELNALSDGPLTLPFDLATYTSRIEVRLFSTDPVDLEIVQLDISSAS